jgi:hypothetical protein
MRTLFVLLLGVLLACWNVAYAGRTFVMETPSELTIASGAITVTKQMHSVDGETDMSDDLDTVSGLSAGRVVILYPVNAARDITLRHNIGNIKTCDGANYTIPDNGFVELFSPDGTSCYMIAQPISTGTKDIWREAGLWEARTTMGAVAGESEIGANLVMTKYFAFNPGANQFIQRAEVLPDRWDCGTLKAKIIWTAASAVESPVVWELRAGSYSDNTAIDTAFGETVQITDTHRGSGKFNISPVSASLTIAGTPSAGDLILFELYRNAATATDTLEESARAIGVMLQYTESPLATFGW